MIDMSYKPASMEIWDCVEAFRAKRPHVHCITNAVAQHFTANVLLAAGATPSMTIALSEVPSFVAHADALLVNLGTLDADRIAASEAAIKVAIESSKPWALDPVFVHVSPERLSVAKHFLEFHPALIRCNLDEASSLFGCGAELSGLAAFSDVGRVLAVTGQTDHVIAGPDRIAVNNGHPHMARITAMGCALNAVLAGFVAAHENQALAVTAGLALFGIAGEVAGERAEGPGTFVPHFLDALAGMEENRFLERLQIT